MCICRITPEYGVKNCILKGNTVILGILYDDGKRAKSSIEQHKNEWLTIFGVEEEEWQS